MSFVIVDNGSKYTQALQKLLFHEKPLVIHYKNLDYKKLSRGDIVILTGGHGDPILWHKKEYTPEIDLIKKHKGPIIGICLGFELIAHVYKSHLHLRNDRRKGEITLIGTSKSPIIIPTKVSVYENHNWSVLKLKRPLVPLAYSKDGVEIMKHARKPIYGIQFHPEESSSAGASVFSEIISKVTNG